MTVLSNCSFIMSSPRWHQWHCFCETVPCLNANLNLLISCLLWNVAFPSEPHECLGAFYEWELGCTPSACSFIKCKGITGNACTRDGECRCPRFPHPLAADVCWEMWRILIAEGDAVWRWGCSHSVWRSAAADTSHKKWGVACDELPSLASTRKSIDNF